VQTLHAAPGSNLYAGRLQRRRHRGAVQLSERHTGPADVTRVGAFEQALLEDRGGQRERGLVRPGVECRDADQLPQGLDRPTALPVRGKPVTERLVVGRGGRGIHRPHRESCSDRTEAFTRGQLPIAGQRATEVQRCRQAVAAQA
jgi:hypothetical protein